MATINIQPFRPYQDTSGGPPFRQAIQEAASQSFKTGAVLIQDGSGKVIEGGTNPARILGVSEEDGHNVLLAALTADIVTHFATAIDDTIFAGNLSTGQTTALTQIGNRYGITKVGDNWTVDTSKTGSSARIFIIDLDRRDNIGDIQGRVLFRFMIDYTAFGSTS